MSFHFENPALNLPDSYAKSEDSNNYKILAIGRGTSDGLEKDIADVFESLDLEKATGKTLDMFGEAVNQPRGVATDEQYRLMILSRVARNFSTGSYPSVLATMCIIFSATPDQIFIEELDDAICTVKVTKLPFDSLNHANMSEGQAMAIIKQLLPVCITLESVNFEGTFEFSDLEAEYYPDRGFDGGYFGILNAFSEEQDLPI